LVQNHEEVGGFLYLDKSLRSGRCDVTNLFTKKFQGFGHTPFRKPIILGPAAHRRCFSLFRCFVSFHCAGFTVRTHQKILSLSLSFSPLFRAKLYTVSFESFITSNFIIKKLNLKGKPTQRCDPVFQARLAGPFYGQIQSTRQERNKETTVVSYQETTKQYFAAPNNLCWNPYTP